MVSPAVPEVNKMLQEEAAQELVKPTIAAGSEKDSEPKTAWGLQLIWHQLGDYLWLFQILNI